PLSCRKNLPISKTPTPIGFLKVIVLTGVVVLLEPSSEMPFSGFLSANGCCCCCCWPMFCSDCFWFKVFPSCAIILPPPGFGENKTLIRPLSLCSAGVIGDWLGFFT